MAAIKIITKDFWLKPLTMGYPYPFLKRNGNELSAL